MRWECGYGHYRASHDGFTYIVSKQWRRGEPMWLAFVHDDQHRNHEVPGPIPLNRRMAMANCESHAMGL